MFGINLVFTENKSVHFTIFTGKRSDNPENPDRVPALFKHTATRTMIKIVGQKKRKARHQAIKEKREKSYDQSRTDQAIDQSQISGDGGTRHRTVLVHSAILIKIGSGWEIDIDYFPT